MLGLSATRAVIQGLGFLAILSASLIALAQAPRALPEKTLPADPRLGDLKDLNGYFPLAVPESKEAWNKRADHVRRQVQVALGLWPMPTKTPACAVIHGKIDKGDYTVERVFLQSFPGHFVSGNLYRPKGKSGKLPGVLHPHGHWANGRFHDAGEDAVRQQIKDGGEKFENGGRSPLQSRCVHLARMGCVSFFYDMVGYADSQQIPQSIAHGFKDRRPHMEGPSDWGYFSPQAESRLQHIMGLQTYNSIRVLDWFSELPDVDPARIGVTGASGGGTQTFILGAVDPRPAAAFPAVMVSTAMQGGCTCENCDYLRVNTGNIELAGLFAPKPLGMTGANDWTVEISTKGLPELKKLYGLMGVPERVEAFPRNEFGHNYNYPSRAAMYAWFNKHLKLGFDTPPEEKDYERLSTEELTVWNAEYPKPDGGEVHERELLKWISEDSDRQIAALTPRDEKSLAKYRHIVGGAFAAMIDRRPSEGVSTEFDKRAEKDKGDHVEYVGLVRNTAHGGELPAIFLLPKDWKKTVVIWIDEQGKAGLYGSDGGLKPEIRKLVSSGVAVASCDLIGQGEFLADGQPLTKARRVKGDRQFAGFTYGYNHPLFVQRAHDVLTMISHVKRHRLMPEKVHLVALNGAGIWALAATTQSEGLLDKVAIDTQGFRFASLVDYDDPNFLPGAVKYGDVPGLLSLVSPSACWISGEPENLPPVAAAAFSSAKPSLTAATYAGGEGGEATAAVDWVLK